MQLLSTISKINELPPSGIKDHIVARHHQLVETPDDIPPIFIIVEEDDDITGPDYAFVSDNGLFGAGDTLGTYETVTHLPDLNMYELLFLVNGEDGYWIYVSDANPDLSSILTTD